MSVSSIAMRHVKWVVLAVLMPAASSAATFLPATLLRAADRLMDAPRVTPNDAGGPEVVQVLADRLTACARSAQPPDVQLAVKAAMLHDVLGQGDTAQTILREFNAARQNAQRIRVVEVKK
jgi:hypothetical protein